MSNLTTSGFFSSQNSTFASTWEQCALDNTTIHSNNSSSEWHPAPEKSFPFVIGERIIGPVYHGIGYTLCSLGNYLWEDITWLASSVDHLFSRMIDFVPKTSAVSDAGFPFPSPSEMKTCLEKSSWIDIEWVRKEKIIIEVLVETFSDRAFTEGGFSINLGEAMDKIAKAIHINKITKVTLKLNIEKALKECRIDFHTWAIKNGREDLLKDL